MNKTKIVEVKWFDAQSSTEVWDIEELENKLEPMISKSVGYLLIEKKDYIILGFTKFGNGLLKHHQCIPRGMIKKIKVIRR